MQDTQHVVGGSIANPKSAAPVLVPACLSPTSTPDPPFSLSPHGVPLSSDGNPCNLGASEFSALGLTRMQAVRWEEQMNKSFAAAQPVEAARILEAIRYGIEVEYEGPRRTQARTCHNPPLKRAEDAEKIAAVIAKDVAEGKKAGPFDCQPFSTFTCSPIGAVPKRDSDKIRVIHNLSYPFHGESVNRGTMEGELKLGSFDEACDIIKRLGPGTLLCKLDVEAAYKQIPVRPRDWPLLGFKWDGAWYYERVLPFGLKSSCRLWEMFACALHHFFVVDLGIECVVHYVDDFLLAFPAHQLREAERGMQAAMQLADWLGLTMAGAKAEGPVTQLTFLGIQLDTKQMVARLSADRLQQLLIMLTTWERKKHASEAELASLLGVLDWACRVIRIGRPFKRRIVEHLKRVKARSRLRGRYSLKDAEMHMQDNDDTGGDNVGGSASTSGQLSPLTDAVQADILWWIKLAPSWNGRGMLYDREWTHSEAMELFTDACNKGYGGYWQGAYFHGVWNAAQLQQARRVTRISIPFLELYALVLSALIWGDQWGGRRIIFRCDSGTAVAALNKMTARDKDMAWLVRVLTLHAAHHGYEFRCIHIEGAQNVIADALSRGGSLLTLFRLTHPQVLTATPERIPIIDPSL